jgi:hypothetical protein
MGCSFSAGLSTAVSIWVICGIFKSKEEYMALLFAFELFMVEL